MRYSTSPALIEGTLASAAWPLLSASRSPGLVRFFGHAWVVLPSDGVPLLDHNNRV